MTAISPLTSTSSLAKQQATYDAANASKLPTQAADGTAITATGKSAATALAGNYETFIKLLTSQLQNQDPLAPTDTAAFTQQLVQYSQVEQQISTNSKLDSILGGITGQSATQYVNYIGKDVTVQGTDLQLTSGKANLSYTLPDNAQSASIQILDAQKNVVATITGSANLGAHSYTWDGIKADGTKAADGHYTFAIQALKSDGTALANVVPAFTGRVTGVKASATGAMLDLAGLSVSPGNVTNITSI